MNAASLWQVMVVFSWSRVLDRHKETIFEKIYFDHNFATAGATHVSQV